MTGNSKLRPMTHSSYTYKARTCVRTSIYEGCAMAVRILTEIITTSLSMTINLTVSCLWLAREPAATRAMARNAIPGDVYMDTISSVVQPGMREVRSVPWMTLWRTRIHDESAIMTPKADVDARCSEPACMQRPAGCGVLVGR